MANNTIFEVQNTGLTSNWSTEISKTKQQIFVKPCSLDTTNSFVKIALHNKDAKKIIWDENES